MIKRCKTQIEIQPNVEILKDYNRLKVILLFYLDLFSYAKINNIWNTWMHIGAYEMFF